MNGASRNPADQQYTIDRPREPCFNPVFSARRLCRRLTITTGVQGGTLGLIERGEALCDPFESLIQDLLRVKYQTSERAYSFSLPAFRNGKTRG